jgi:hypothetical protein
MPSATCTAPSLLVVAEAYASESSHNGDDLVATERHRQRSSQSEVSRAVERISRTMPPSALGSGGLASSRGHVRRSRGFRESCASSSAERFSANDAECSSDNSAGNDGD